MANFYTNYRYTYAYVEIQKKTLKKNLTNGSKRVILYI